MADVIVAGSNFVTTLGIVRAVGMAGYGVRLLATTEECEKVLRGSVFITKTHVCIDVNDICNALEVLRGEDEAIPIIPTGDIVMSMLDSRANELSKHYLLPNVNNMPGELVAFMDKLCQKKLAVACGLPVAEGDVYTADYRGMKKALADAHYPCVIKAICSADSFQSKALFSACKNSDELEKAMKAACVNKWRGFLIEGFLDIDKEYAVYGLAMHGKVAIPACLHTWRSGHGAHKGVTAEGVMLSPTFLGEYKGKLEEFVRRSGYNGLFCIDLILSEDKYYFVEMNLRYGSSGYAVTAGGVNLPGDYVNAVTTGREIDEESAMVFEPRFLNEKVDLDDYRVGYMSWKEYKEHQKGDKVRFMKSDDDPEPWKQFQVIERKKHIARLLRGTKKRH